MQHFTQITGQQHIPNELIQRQGTLDMADLARHEAESRQELELRKLDHKIGRTDNRAHAALDHADSQMARDNASIANC